MQPVQHEAIRFAGCGSGTGCKAFDVELRERPRKVGEQAWSVGRRCRADQLGYGGELVGSAVDRRVLLVRAMENEGCGEDQVYGDDRGDHQRRDLSADTPEIQKTQ